MQLTTYLNFNGNCGAAFKFYAEILNGKITSMMTMGESPMANNLPPEMKEKIMHVALEVPGGGLLMGADHPHGKSVLPTGFCVSVQLKDMAEGERIFRGLSAGGQIQMPFEKTFWSPGFGMLIDRFNIPWMVNCFAGE